MNNVLIGLTSYNKYQFTYLCLKYLEKNTPRLKDGTARLILLDNNSTDYTQDKVLKDFPWIEKLIIPEIDCIPHQLNLFVKELKDNEDFVMCPQDVCVGPNWLEFLQEDVYSNENIIMGSPYMPLDLAWDDVINDLWNSQYLKEYYNIRNMTTPEELEVQLNSLYLGGFDDFCLDFQERNEEGGLLDNALTHLILFKNKLFTKDNYRFPEKEFPRYFGGWEFSLKAEMNNFGYYNISSSQSFAHHWLSISNQESNIPLNEKQKIVRSNNLKLLGMWEAIPESVYFFDSPRPENISNWKTPYYRFKKINLEEEEASKQPGTSFMCFCGLKPGENYFNQIRPGSVLTDGKRDYFVNSVVEERDITREGSWFYRDTFLVPGLTRKKLVLDSRDGEGLELTENEFLYEGWSVVYYWREEEKKLNDYWRERML